MSKAHRGSPLKRSEGNIRGTCPISGKTGVKLLYEHTDENGKKIKISKPSYAKIKNEIRIAERKAKSKEAKVSDAPPVNTDAPQVDTIASEEENQPANENTPEETTEPVETSNEAQGDDASDTEE